MKKILLACTMIVGLLGSAIKAEALATSSIIFTNGVFTNFPGLANTLLPIQVTSVIVANSTTNPQTLLFYDIPTNYFTNVVPAYTNTVSFLTNYIFQVTNYYGAISTNTNYVLYDNTNNAVAAVTNTALPKLILTVPALSSYATPAGVVYQFSSGVWITNSSPATAGLTGVPAVTITYK
jgi:hypothetical protein